MPSAAIYDCEGPLPTADEIRFFRDADPAGFILFARHCETPAAAAACVSALRDGLGRDDVLVLIDQEGGRVARMKPPAFPEHPPMAAFGELYRLDPVRARAAARRNAFLLGRMVLAAGVNVNCVPMLDVPQIDADPGVIGDRAIAKHPDQIADLGLAVIEGLVAGGATPVIKHLPGHGRALVDSHQALPRVGGSRDDLRSVDFKPFRALKDAAKIGMTAHIVYDAYDPTRCATMSPTVIGDAIRGEIGFDGFLLSDDVKMKALDGPFETRAAAAIAAGCDAALCCNMTLKDYTASAAATPALSGRSLKRYVAAVGAADAAMAGADDADVAPLYDELYGTLAPVWRPSAGASA